MNPKHKDINTAILALAVKRGPDKTTCPSEVARQLFPDDWRAHMKDVLNAAINLSNQGKIFITQKGAPVDVNHIKGPVRIKIR